MFVVFDDSIWSLDDDTLRSMEMDFELILHAHHRRTLLLYLPPAAVNRVSVTMTLGPVSKAILSAINRKAADYGAAIQQASRVFRLCPDNHFAEPFRIGPLGVVYVRISEFVHRRLSHKPQLYVEHGRNDTALVEMIFDAFCLLENMPRGLVSISATHGGGSSLGDVLRDRPDGGLIGVCLTDRDTHPFDPAAPFRPGGTASAAYDAAIELNAIEVGQFGLSTTEPFFSFELTGSRTIEGYIGPHLFDEFLRSSGADHAFYSAFLDAFPSFPNLCGDEMALWFSTNLKDGTSTIGELTNASISAGIDPSMHNIPLITGLKFPRNTARWLTENMLTGRFKRTLQRAFQLDYQQELYGTAARTLACRLFDLLSADARMAIA